MAIDQNNNAKLTISNAPRIEDNAFISTDFLPKDPAFGKRHIRIANSVLLEKIDIDGIIVGENIVLMRWGKCKLRCCNYFNILYHHSSLFQNLL